MTDIQQKIQAAQQRIKDTVELVGLNRVYAAYSGGKDSLAVLRLCRELYPEMLAIHNCHDGEGIDPSIPNVLSINQPKAEMVPAFLKTVTLAAQIDGTRRDEDKTVIFESEEIHRSKMPNWKTDTGVFGLLCCFPLFDWSEEEVYQYLEMTGEPTFYDMKQSLEGEGPRIGMNTIFVRYNPNLVLPVNCASAKQVIGACRNTKCLYVTASNLTPALGTFVSDLSKDGTIVTIEVPSNAWVDLKVEGVQYFIVANEVSKPSRFPCYPNIFIKFRVRQEHEFDLLLAHANLFADEGHQCLVVLEWHDTSCGSFREKILSSLSKIHPGVRIMPPMQQLLGID